MTIYRNGQAAAGSAGVSEETIRDLVRSANKDLLEELGAMIAMRGVTTSAASRRLSREDPEALRQLAREMASAEGDLESNFSELGKRVETAGSKEDDDIVDMLAGIGETE